MYILTQPPSVPSTVLLLSTEEEEGEEEEEEVTQRFLPYVLPIMAAIASPIPTVISPK
jgi:hypothetical protein